MKNSMVRMIKKVTAAVLAAATVMGATVAATPAIVKADDFKTIDFESLPEHPTANMDLTTIKNAYFVFESVGENINSGDVLYVDSHAAGALDGSTPNGTDIVVVIRKYNDHNIFGTEIPKVSCKSLIDGETFDELVISNSGEMYGARFYEICKKPDFNSNGGIKVDTNGLSSNSCLLEDAFGWVKSLIPFLKK